MSGTYWGVRGEGSGGLLSRALVLWMIVVGALVVVPPVGIAAPMEMGGFIGGSFDGSGPGGRFNQPRDVAVFEATNKTLVMDSNNQRVQRFDVHGNFERMWGKDVVRDGRPGDTGSGFEVCVVASDCQVPPGPTGSRGGEFNSAQGIAVDQVSGHVYVMDRGNLRVQEFDLDGGFVRAWGWDVVDGTASPGAPGDDTVAPLNEMEVCTSRLTCKAGVAGVGAGQFGATTTNGVGIAVDPVNGDVFVADPGTGSGGNRRVEQFSSAGMFIAHIGGTGVSSTFAAGNPLRIAVDSNHIVYASDTAASNRVQRYDSVADAFLGPITCCAPTVGSPLVAGTTLGLEIDADTDGGGADEEHLVALRRDSGSSVTTVQEFDIPTPATDPISTAFENSPIGALGSPTNGLGANSATGIYYVATATETLGGATGQIGLIVLAEGGGGGPLEAVVGSPSDVGSHEAVLQGFVNPVGGVARYQFEISDTGGADDWVAVGGDSYLSGSTTGPVWVRVTGLVPNTAYRVRLVARKVTGPTTAQSVVSSEGTFLTDASGPDAETFAASPRRATSAGLQGSVNPQGAPTGYRFEYGTTTGYGKKVPDPDGFAGSGGTSMLVHETVLGLTPATSYHYRLKAENPYGSDFGVDQSFTTATGPSPQGARRYELVTPSDKSTGPGTGGHGSNAELGGELGLATGLPSRSGDRLISNTLAGPVLTPGASVYANDYALAERTENGWANQSAFNRRNYGSPQAPFLDLVSASDDLETTAWSAFGGQPTLFEDQPPSDSTTYLRDWEGRWRYTADESTITQTIAADGGAGVLNASFNFRGLLGDGDASKDQVTGGAGYLTDVSDGIADTWESRGPSELLGGCTLGTEIPERLGDGRIDVQPCPSPAEYAPGSFRDSGLISSRGAVIANTLAGNWSTKNAVSDDGSRVFFMSPDPQASDPDGGGPLTAGSQPCGPGVGLATSCPAQLFVRQRNEDGSMVTRWISRPQVPGQNASLLGPAFYEGATPDGDKVYFRTTTPLTADDPNAGCGAPCTTGAASSNSWDLYVYDLPDGVGADPAAGTLTRISAGPTANADANNPQGSPGDFGATASSLRFVSEDGGRVYFVTAAPLPGVEGTDNGTITTPAGTTIGIAASNLYLYEPNSVPAERWKFVARLPRAITGSVGTGVDNINGCASTGARQGQSRDYAGVGGGGSTIWSSVAVGLNNCVRGTVDGGFVTFWTAGGLTADDPDGVSGDVYGFDAVGGELVRLSAPQGGGAGGSYQCLGSVEAPSGVCHGDPGFRFGDGDRVDEVQLGVATDPAVPGQKVAFFESKSRLTSDDVDDEMDVFEWRDGELSLVSVGVEDTGAYYSGNDMSGEDVFFVTKARLTWDDIDGVRDIYDARVGGGFDPPQPAPVCPILSDGCQGEGRSSGGAVVERSSGAGGGNVVVGDRAVVRLVRPSSRGLRRARRTGRIGLRVFASRPGRLRAVARARVDGRRATVARGSKTVRRPGSVRLVLRLSPGARDRLRSGRGLRLSVRVRMAGARTQSMGLLVRGVDR